jgi:hypothetical protein
MAICSVVTSGAAPARAALPRAIRPLSVPVVAS